VTGWGIVPGKSYGGGVPGMHSHAANARQALGKTRMSGKFLFRALWNIVPDRVSEHADFILARLKR
jgi:hypothetical protein